METIDNKIYDILGTEVERRKKPLLLPLISLALGCAFWGCAFLCSDPNLYFGLLMWGVLVMLISAGVVLVRLFGGNNVPFYVTGGERFRRIEKYYAYESLSELQACISRADSAALGKLKTVDASNVKLVCYNAPKSGLSICQIMTYVPHEYRPASEVVVMK